MSLNTIGLICNFLGTLLLALFGLPKSELLSDGTQIVQTSGNDQTRKKAKWMHITSMAGIWMIVLGFFLQLIFIYYH